jgi:cation diffusion facilitator CzcD-associated flavoprotein CzcO
VGAEAARRGIARREREGVVSEATETTVAIVGTGFSGLCMAIQLKERGITDIVLLERAQTVGGTWRDNTYPGAACDVPSHLYSFSFAPNPDWSHRFARQGEIWTYLEDCADRFGIRRHVWFGAELIEARFDEAAARWHLRCTDGRRLIARFVVVAMGGLRDPRMPEIPGIETFAGPSMHSARWNHGVSLAGKRVGVIGTGASAIQIVPALAGTASEVHLFQRTPAWVRPRGDRAYTAKERARFRQHPVTARLERLRTYARLEVNFPLFFRRGSRTARAAAWLLRQNIRRQVPDPDLARALTPDYAVGCKRVLLSDDYLPAMVREDVHLHTDRIVQVVPEGVVLQDGRRVELDVLVYCTGFTVDAPLGQVDVYGRGGFSLREAWKVRPRAYLGITVPRFPNAFVLLGPNTALGHNSIVVMIEAQVRYALQAILATVKRSGRATVEVKAEVEQGFIEEVDLRHQDLVWAAGCQSWYLAAGGENFTIWPGSTLSYMWRTRKWERGEFVEG